MFSWESSLIVRPISLISIFTRRSVMSTLSVTTDNNPVLWLKCIRSYEIPGGKVRHRPWCPGCLWWHNYRFVTGFVRHNWGRQMLLEFHIDSLPGCVTLSVLCPLYLNSGRLHLWRLLRKKTLRVRSLIISSVVRIGVFWKWSVLSRPVEVYSPSERIWKET